MQFGQGGDTRYPHSSKLELKKKKKDKPVLMAVPQGFTGVGVALPSAGLRGILKSSPFQH